MLPAEVRPYLHAVVVGRRLFYYPETGSTNDVAMAAARDGEPEGGVFYAGWQRAGRGRGRASAWESPPGCDILFSVVLRPGGELRDILPVTLIVALALSVALTKGTGEAVGVKWPNDLMAGGRKLGGILAESGPGAGGDRFAVVGVGINVNAERFEGGLGATAVSCRMLTGAPVDRAPLLGDLLTTIDSYYGRFRSEGFGAFAGAYRDRLVHLGRAVRFERDGRRVTAVTEGVAADGALRVVADDGTGFTLYNESLEIVA